MKVAVTGGSGHVGRFTVEELLAHGHEVRNLDRAPPAEKRCPFRQVDLTDLGQVAVSLEGCGAVIHLAAIPSPGGIFPDQVVYVNNTVSNYNVLQAAALLGIRKICVASSVNAIGLSYSRAPVFDYFPVDERHPSRVEDCYSLSKWCGEQVADAFARLHGAMTISSMRYHGVVNPERYADWRKRRREAPGEPKHLWSYTDARDAARANRLAVEAGWTGHEAFFITANDTCEETPSAELARRFYPDVPLKKPLEGHASFFDNSKAKKLLGWEHEHGWREGG